MAVQMKKSQPDRKDCCRERSGQEGVKGVLETLATIGYKELRKIGVFWFPDSPNSW